MESEGFDPVSARPIPLCHEDRAIGKRVLSLRHSPSHLAEDECQFYLACERGQMPSHQPAVQNHLERYLSLRPQAPGASRQLLCRGTPTRTPDANFRASLISFSFSDPIRDQRFSRVLLDASFREGSPTGRQPLPNSARFPAVTSSFSYSVLSSLSAGTL